MKTHKHAMPTLLSLWNSMYYAYYDRPTQKRAAFLHYARQRYMDYGKRGKGNKALKRAEALYRDTALLFWPDYI